MAVEDDSSAAADDVTKEPTGRSVMFSSCCAELLASFVFTFLLVYTETVSVL